MSASSPPPRMGANEALPDRLRRQTGEASRRQTAVETEIDNRLSRQPEAGDLFVLAETAEHLVEWAILDRDPADPRRLLAVPADTNSLIGSADVAVSTGSRGRLSLRCAYPIWIDAEACDPALRTGFLEPETLEQARQKRDGVERGTDAGSVLEREVDGEADYREWTEVLDQAVAATSGHARGAPEEHGRATEPETGAEEPGKVLRFGRRSGWGPAANMLALAASVLLIVSLGLGRKLMRSSDEHQAVVAEQRGELARLAQERQQLEDSHRQDLARLDGERQRLELEHLERIAELEAEPRPTPAVNLPLLILASGQLRGHADTLEVAPDAGSLILILQVDDPEAYDRYRIEIRETASRRLVWRDGSLKPSRLSELTVLLPRSLMADGRYELRLHGLADGPPEQLMEHILTLTTAQRRANGTP